MLSEILMNIGSTACRTPGRSRHVVAGGRPSPIESRPLALRTRSLRRLCLHLGGYSVRITRRIADRLCNRGARTSPRPDRARSPRHNVLRSRDTGRKGESAVAARLGQTLRADRGCHPFSDRTGQHAGYARIQRLSAARDARSRFHRSARQASAAATQQHRVPGRGERASQVQSIRGKRLPTYGRCNERQPAEAIADPRPWLKSAAATGPDLGSRPGASHRRVSALPLRER
jgi:hypothetical protein